MNKDEFLTTLSGALSGLSESDIRERVDFYREMIEDHVEDGVSEEEAVAEIGEVDTVVRQIMSEIPLAKLVKEKVRPKRKLKAWEIVLLILGSPIWVPLLLSVAIVVFSVYIVIWTVVVCIYAADISLVAGALGGILGIALFIREAKWQGAIFSFGTGLVSAGLAILLFFVCVWITKSVVRLTGMALSGLKTSFIRKEEN